MSPESRLYAAQKARLTGTEFEVRRRKNEKTGRTWGAKNTKQSEQQTKGVTAQNGGAGKSERDRHEKILYD